MKRLNFVFLVILSIFSLGNNLQAGFFAPGGEGAGNTGGGIDTTLTGINSSLNNTKNRLAAANTALTTNTLPTNSGASTSTTADPTVNNMPGSSSTQSGLLQQM